MIEVVSRCPVCGHRVNAAVGTPTPPHSADGSVVPCKGTGQPSD